jgi:hypothetical protein
VIKALACFAYVRSLPFGCIADSAGTSGHGRAAIWQRRLPLQEHLAGGPVALAWASLRACALSRSNPTSCTASSTPDGPPLEHAYAEVLLDDRWQAVDSYVVDMRLAMAAKSRLAMEGPIAGLRHACQRRHHLGRLQSNSFGQFHATDRAACRLHDWGAFDDPYQFYSSVPDVRERLSWSTRIKWLVGASVVNRKVNGLRNNPGKPGTSRVAMADRLKSGEAASTAAKAQIFAPEN